MNDKKEMPYPWLDPLLTNTFCGLDGVWNHPNS